MKTFSFSQGKTFLSANPRLICNVENRSLVACSRLNILEQLKRKGKAKRVMSVWRSDFLHKHVII